MAAIVLHALSTASATYKIGFIYPQTQEGWAIESHTMLKLAIADVGASGVLPVNTSLVCTERSSIGGRRGTIGDEGAAFSAASEMFSDPEMVGLIGTAYSSALHAPAMLASHLHKPIVSPSSTAISLADKTDKPFLLRTIGSAMAELETILDTIVALGWSTIGCVASPDYSDAVQTVLTRAAHARGIDLAFTVVIPPQDVKLDGHFRRVVSKKLDSLKASGVRIIIELVMLHEKVALQAIAEELGLYEAGRYVWFGFEGVRELRFTAPVDYVRPSDARARELALPPFPLPESTLTISGARCVHASFSFSP